MVHDTGEICLVYWALSLREAILVAREDMLLFRAAWGLGKRRSIAHLDHVGFKACWQLTPTAVRAARPLNGMFRLWSERPSGNKSAGRLSQALRAPARSDGAVGPSAALHDRKGGCTALNSPCLPAHEPDARNRLTCGWTRVVWPKWQDALVTWHEKHRILR